MPVSDYSTTPADNTSISGLDVSNATVVSTIDDIVRQMMADIRSADDANMKLTGDQTATGTKSFATVVAGFGRITTASASRLDLQATSVADTHERTRLVRDTTAFRQQTASSDAATTVDDYIAPIGATGATSHQWNVAGVQTFTVAANAALVTGAGATVIDLAATNTTDTHERARLFKNTSGYGFQTVDAASTVAVTDYFATVGASGVTQHSWRIAGVEQIRVDGSNFTVSGTIIPSTTLGIGEAGNRFTTIFLTTSPNVSSDARLKEDIRDITAAELRAARRMRTVAYRLKSDGSQHYGYIAQEIVAAMEDEGLDAIKAGLVSLGEDGMYGINEDAINAFRIEALARG